MEIAADQAMNEAVQRMFRQRFDWEMDSGILIKFRDYGPYVYVHGIPGYGDKVYGLTTPPQPPKIYFEDSGFPHRCDGYFAPHAIEEYFIAGYGEKIVERVNRHRRDCRYQLKHGDPDWRTHFDVCSKCVATEKRIDP